MADGCTLLILAGGRSRRMGRDKAGLPAGNGTLVEHLVRRLAPVAAETLVAGAPQIGTIDGVRRIEDRYPGMGPLAGIHAGLVEAGRPWVWVVACDLPDVEPALGRLLGELATGVDAVVPRVEDEAEGVCALYHRSLCPRIASMLEAGRRRVQDLLAQVEVRYVTAAELRQVDPELRSFRNLNTPADYQAWLTTR
jgi:molybdopterin-guanine dinucleotide biosynthesis protein A